MDAGRNACPARGGYNRASPSATDQVNGLPRFVLERLAAHVPDIRLERLARKHAPRLERFERTNRAFFARHVADRGDRYFAEFRDRLGALVDENEAGRCLLFVILDERDEIVGRVNITDIDRPARTELGFRIAESVQGHGVATAGVTQALEQAASAGVREVRARASVENHASRRVLERCGFEATGPAPTPPGSNRTFLGYRRDLTCA